MVAVRKFANGNYYLCRTTSTNNRGKWADSKTLRNWWFVKYRSDSKNGCQQINVGSISLPKELVGKKIRFKIEQVEDIK